MLLTDLKTNYRFTTTRIIRSLSINLGNGIQVIYVIFSRKIDEGK